MNLPEAFIQDLKPYLAAIELEEFCHALSDTDASTSIRLNQQKLADRLPWKEASEHCTPIAWNMADGRYLAQRPQFTLDPLLHAGAYYVQEAASQFVTHILRTLLPADQPVRMLDLCAAPGGKSTAALSVLPEGSLLVSNEIDHRRARILAENITKWGYPNVIVTGNAPAEFTSLTHLFDVILTDVPCSGEGMFRKDEGAVNDWSEAKVNGCVELQRQILQDIWPALKPGGLLIYGTCTFNVHEDEEQIRYICDELGAEPVEVPVDEAWNIHKPLTDQLPCYRFMPHYTQGEGLFMAALRKNTEDGLLTPRWDEGVRPRNARKDAKGKQTGKGLNMSKGMNAGKESRSMNADRDGKGMNSLKSAALDMKKITQEVMTWVKGEGSVETTHEGTLRFIPAGLKDLHDIITQQGLYLLQSGIELGTIKGRDVIPAHALALNTGRNPEAFPMVELDKETALNYLRREAITLPLDAPTGYVVVCHDGLALGFVKNMGKRSNNLYPQEWRIRMC